ncbi:fibronectin type III domain-containing protein [Actinoplanes sp. NPDC051513]|uniref:fibronectin type III domain-containing protein n=1 Tax=Actinoplanes sp. NPDC051513 TaxID=3363908 RepID=UPI0037976D55
MSSSTHAVRRRRDSRPAWACVAMISIFAVGRATPVQASPADPPPVPSGRVASVTVTPIPGNPAVDVSWEPLDPAGWNGSQIEAYEVHMTAPEGANPTNGCDALIADTTCMFIADKAGVYTATVAAYNETGASAESTGGIATLVLDPPAGPVTSLVATSANDPATGTADVGVTWDALAPEAWNFGSRQNFHVRIDAPGGGSAGPGACSGDLTETSCHFTPTDSGRYTIHVAPVNEAGTGASADTTVDVALTPDAAVGHLAVTPIGADGHVNVTWDPVPEDAWNGDTHHYDIQVTPAGDGHVVENYCGQWAEDDATSIAGCGFAVDAADTYTVTVTAVNEFGASTQSSSENADVTMGRPAAAVADLRVAGESGPGVVDVSWTPLDDEAWNGALNRFYSVAVTGPGDEPFTGPGSCAAQMDVAASSCSFSVGDGGYYQVQVVAISEGGVSEPAGAGIQVTLAPTGTVGPVDVVNTPGSGHVELSWPQMTDGWGGAQQRKYEVTITGGGTLSDNTCDSVPDVPEPSCSFTAGAAGPITVVVTAANEAGAAAGGVSADGLITLAPTAAPVVPVATVTGLQVLPAIGDATVQVGWDVIPAGDDAWNGAITTHDYVVSIVGPDGATIDPGTCTTVSSASCQFSTDRGGDYTVGVALSNEAGTSVNAASNTGHLTLAVPSGQVGAVTADSIPGTGIVELSWSALDDSDWSEGVTRSYAATIGGDMDLLFSTCDSVPAPATSCYVETNASGPFTAEVKAVNEAGAAVAGGSVSGTVVLAPRAAVSTVHVSTSINSPTVTVSWDQLTTGWESGVEKTYAVSVQGPSADTLANDGCTNEPVVDSDAPSCTFDVSEGGDYVVSVQAVSEGGPGPSAEETAHVTLEPTATIAGVTVGAVPGSSTVNVGWDRLPETGWNGGSTHYYLITLQAPPNAVIGATTCTTVADTDDPHCTFTTDIPGAYTAQVTAANEAGPADTPGVGTGTLAAGVPAAATGVTGTSGVNAITASWTAAVATSLAGVSSYTVSAVADGYPDKTCAGTVTTSPCTITDVAAGVPYTVRVVTDGPGGSSAPADSAVEVVPTGAPQAPVAVPTDAVPAGSGTTAPGATITITGSGYAPYSTVVLSLFSNPVSLGTATADANGNIAVTVSLPAGTPTGSHTLLATGLDSHGAVLNLAKSVAVTTPPATTPTAARPTGAVASLAARQVAPGNRSAVVTWAPGQVSWGDGAGRGYDVSVSGPGDARITGSCTQPVAGSATSCEFSTDTNGAYAVRVTAATDAGRSGAFASAAVTVTTAPGAPTAVTGTPGANSISVSWKPPASAGAGILGYTVTVTAPYHPVRGCGSVTSSPCTVTGLAAGVRYVARVVANGRDGDSPMASSAITITAAGNVHLPTELPKVAVDNGSRAAAPGAKVIVTGAGYRPGTRVRLAFYPGGTSLGATTASAKGTVAFSVTMPARGSRTLLTIGLDNRGRVRYLATVLRVRAI